MGNQSDLEDTLDEQLRGGDAIPHDYVRQFQFAKHIGRKWASDFAWEQHRLLVEVEGATWAGGRHTTGAGFHLDCEKYNKAAILGYTVLRFDSNMVKDGTAVAVIYDWFERQA